MMRSGLLRVWLPCWTNLRESDRTSCRGLSKTGRCDAQDGNRGSGAVCGGGKGDGRTFGYAAADCGSAGWGEGGGLRSRGRGDRGGGVQDGVSRPQRSFEESGHRCSSSGNRRTSIHASGTVRGGLSHDGRFGIRGAIVIPAIGRARWTAWGQSGRCSELARGSGGGRVVAADGAGDELCRAARHVTGSAGDSKGV